MKLISERLKVENRISWGRDDVIGIAIVMVAIFAWTFTRVRSINPAILGDEYLYSLNARHAAPWAESPAGDFSNYFFNIVFSATNLCGDSFYTCAKGLNTFFFVLTILVVFVILRKYLQTQISLVISFLAGLSPLSVYASMMLPESMYFFFLSIVLLSIVWALDHPLEPLTWARVGAILGVATLVKPHAWLSAMGIAIFVTVAQLTADSGIIKKTLFSLGAFFGAAATARVIFGLIVAGPKALGFFGIYLNPTIVDEFVLPESSPSEGESPLGTTPLNGAITLFWDQLQIHSVTMASLMAIPLVGLLVAAINVSRSRSIRGVDGLGLFLLIWGLSMLVAVVLFSGWITGGGDDHSTRVLLRYYEFFFLFGPVVGLTVLWRNRKNIHVSIRWLISIGLGFLVSTGFTGFFGGLTIQIADAPSLAGLIVDELAYNSLALLAAAGLLAFATFPELTKWLAATSLIVSFSLTGWNIQNQYNSFRGTANAADIAGTSLGETTEQISAMVIGSSRFEVTNAAFWVDEPTTKYEIVVPAATYPVESLPNSVNFVILLSDVALSDSQGFEEYSTGEGYLILQRTKS